MTTRRFDGVGNMRRIRDELSRQFASMSFDEQRRFIEGHRGAPAARVKERHNRPRTKGDAPQQFEALHPRNRRALEWLQQHLETEEPMPQEWWDDLDRELAQNRLNLPDRT